MPPMMPRVALLALAACSPKTTDTADTAPPGSEPAPQATPRDAGWLKGDLHQHTTYSDGYDPVAVVVALSEYLDDPDFLAFHPEYVDNSLDFAAISDHRTVDAMADPDFHSDEIVLVPSEESSAGGHANIPGVTTYVDHDPDGDGTTLEDVLAAIEAAHAQGALFSPNHHLIQGIPWAFDARDIDTVEVWNSGWALASPGTTADDLASWEAGHGPASPFFRRAVLDQGTLSNHQALTMVEAMLSRGVHVGVVGGSDRHALLLPGFPTTYVRAPEGDLQAVLDGMAARHTYVSRTPVSGQVLATFLVDGAEYLAGDAIPVAAGGTEVTVEVRVTRAEGGLLRLVQGGYVETDEAVETAPLGAVVAEEEVASDDHLLTYTFTAVPGDWLYPLLLEPLVAPGLTEADGEVIRDLATAAATAGEDYVDIALAVGPYLDLEILGDPTRCDPEDWSEETLQCVLADMDGMATFYVPDRLDRAMNAWVEDGAVTDWCMGAVGSAVLFVEAGG